MSDFNEQIMKASVAVERSKLDIITGTLDALNAPTGGKSCDTQKAMSDSYDFQKTVLSAVYEGKGTLIDQQKG